MFTKLVTVTNYNHQRVIFLLLLLNTIIISQVSTIRFASVTNGNYAQQIPVYTGNAFGIQDPIIQHQPVISNQYNTKRESIPQHVTGTGNDNPFLSNRQPKSITATIRTNHRNDDDGTKGWIPIPYPLYK